MPGRCDSDSLPVGDLLRQHGSIHGDSVSRWELLLRRVRHYGHLSGWYILGGVCGELHELPFR